MVRSREEGWALKDVDIGKVGPPGKGQRQGRAKAGEPEAEVHGRSGGRPPASPNIDWIACLSML